MNNQHASNAHRYLDSLRGGTSVYKELILRVRAEIREGNLSLAEIGTSEKELESLWVKGCKTTACQYLDNLRGGTSVYKELILRVRAEIREGNLSLAEIGTSEKELESLWVKGCKTTACQYLDSLKYSTDRTVRASLIERICAEARKGKFSLTEVGTSEEKLEALKKVP